jgi:O-antigen/teichoic acid export membrane protein
MASLIGGTAAGQALIFASTPVISRIYSKADLGKFGLFLSFLSVAGVAATARFELAIPGAPRDDEAVALLKLALVVTLPASLVCAAVLWALRAAGLLSFPDLPVWAIGASVPATVAFGWFAALRYWYIRRHRFGAIGKVLIVQSAGRASIPIVLGWLTAGPIGLVVGEVTGRVLGVTTLLRGAMQDLARPRAPEVTLRSVAASNWKYPGILLPSGLLDALSLSLPIPLIAQHFGVAAAGTFLLVQRLSTLPTALIATSAGDVFHMRIVGALGHSADEARRIVNKAAGQLLLIAAVVFVPAIALAPLVLPAFFGPGWRDSGLLFAVVAPWSMAALIVSPVSRVLAVAERKELKLIYDFVSLALLIGSIASGGHFGWGFISTVGGMSAGQIAAYFLYFFLIRRACAQRSVAPR